MALLEVRNLSVRFGSSRGEVAAVREVSFSIAAREVLGLVGESGSGKSVTSLAIMRLLVPQARAEGEIHFDGRNLLTASDDEMRSLRGRRIAMIFQEPMTALNPVMRVGDQVAEAAMVHAKASSVAGRPSSATTNRADAEAATQDVVPGRRPATDDRRRVSKSDAWKLAVEALRDVGIPDPERRARDFPHQLSGGQRQRVMIAIAIVNRPQLLIADEPTTALDVTIQAQILDLLAELREKFALAMLFISHDLAVVSQVAQRVAVMYCGSIVEMANAPDLFRGAAHPYTRGLLQSVPTLRTERGQPLRTIDGTVPAITALPPGCAFEPRCEMRIDDCARALPPLVEVAPGHWARCPVLQRMSR